jgi:Tfp pilus assembly protein PilF
MDVFLPVYENEEGGFLMASHAERLKKSHCFLKSQDTKLAQNLNCITCHNPHISVKTTGRDYFIQKCKDCHTQPHKNDPQILADPKHDCLSCHMPRTSPVDIPLVTITDHYIRVVKDTVKAKFTGVGKFKGLACLNDPSPDALSKIKAYLYFYEKFEHRSQNLDSAYALLSKYPAGSQPDLYIYYYYLRQRPSEIIKVNGLRKGFSSDAITNYQVGQAFLDMNEYGRAELYLARAVKIQPLNLDYRVKLATSYLYQHKFGDGIKELEFVNKENPKLSSSWNTLGYAMAMQGDLKNALTYFNRSLALDPDYIPAHINLANLWLNQSKPEEAIAELKKVLNKDPQNVDALQLMTIAGNLPK